MTCSELTIRMRSAPMHPFWRTRKELSRWLWERNGRGRAHFGTTQLSQQQRQELLQYVNELIRQRTEPPQGNAEGGPVQRYAKGGIVKRKIHVAKDLASMKAELMKGR